MWRRRVSALALLLLPTLALGAGPAERTHGGDLEQAWFRVAQALDPLNVDLVKARCDELLQVTEKLEVRRLTPLALALALRARVAGRPNDEAILVQAARLDPNSAEVWFQLANLRLRRGQFLAGASALVHGTSAMLSDTRLRTFVFPSLLITVLLSLLTAFALWALLAVRRIGERVWHDLNEMGASWRLGSNAPVLAVLIIALPLFAGADPAWLVLWVFALGWAYFSDLQKVLGVCGLALLAVTPTLLDLGFRSLTHPPNAVLQAANAMAERRYDPKVLDELAALSDVLGDNADFHRLRGDVMRQTGLYEAAEGAYREGLRWKPEDPALSMGMGVVRYLESDYNAALQAFQVAERGHYDPVTVNYNLSLTYAQTYHFKESDEAMAAARLQSAKRLVVLAPGADHQLIMPVLTPAEARAFIARKDPVVLLNRGILPPPLVPEQTFFHPITIAGVAALLIAVGHFLLRRHLTGFASACLKCGRPFCRRCKLSQESQSYCTQCVNIFLKKDMVPIDLQLSKRKQVARFKAWHGIERRVCDVIVPGLGLAFGGRAALGALFVTVASVCAGLALVWFPHFLSPALMHSSMWPFEAIFGGGWLVLIVLAQVLGGGRR